MRRINCFFCYSWDNSDKYDYLLYLKQVIEKRSNNRIHVVLDKKDYHYNDNFDDKLKALETYELIVVFFSPEFKAILTEADVSPRREVLKEWRRILTIYNENPDMVYPVVLSGKAETSLPPIFLRRNVANIESFLRLSKKQNRKGKVVVNSGARVAFNEFRNSIIQQAVFNSSIKSPEYKSAHEALNKLFLLTDTANLPHSCLVRLSLYNKIATQESFYVIGRKGSGKSTLVKNLRKHISADKFDASYKPVYPLNAEAFNHEESYRLLVSDHISDYSIVTTHDVLVVFWEVYITLQCIMTIGREIDEGFDGIEKKWRKDIFKKISNKLKEYLKLKKNQREYLSYDRDGVQRTMFSFAVELVNKQFLDAVDDGNNEHIFTPFIAMFNSELILNNAFGESNFKSFLSAIRECTRKIMISLDGFDTNTDDFRRETVRMSKEADEYYRRLEYDVMFFRTLIEVVTNVKSQNYHSDPMFTIGEQLDFCIVLPRDRYDQIRDSDRDSFKKRFYPLVWDAHELLEILVKRLEYLIAHVDASWKADTSVNLFRRMDNALAFFNGIPNHVDFQVNNNKISMSLFNFILRFSFWRPRDVISNLSAILSGVLSADIDGNLALNSQKLGNEEVKRLVRYNARELLKQEFYGEYKYVFNNLAQVLREFDGGPLQMSFDTFSDLMAPVMFNTVYSIHQSNVDDKLRVLYQLGAVGLYCDDKTTSHHLYLHNICYTFNAGMKPLEDFLNSPVEARKNVDIILNPMLSSDFLIKFNTVELVGNWSEDYVEQLHRMNYIIHTL